MHQVPELLKLVMGIQRSVDKIFSIMIVRRVHCGPGGLLKYDLGRGVPLRLEKWTHFIPNLAKNENPFLYQSHKFLSKIN